MGNFLRSQKRKAEYWKNREVNKRIKQVYKIIGELDEVAKDIKSDYPNKEFTEDNIAEIASEYTDIKIDNFEKFILLGKLHHATERNI